MSAFNQPVPSYAEVSYSVTDKRTGKVTNTFNPAWLGWFLSLNQHVNGSVDLTTDVEGVLPVGNGGTGVDISTYFSGTLILAKITGLGSNGSLTVVNGLISAAVAPT